MPSNIATSADYADAMMIARRAKNWLFLLLLLFLLAQLAIFFVARYTNYVFPAAPAHQSLADEFGDDAATPATLPTTRAAATSSPAKANLIHQTLIYLTAIIDFLGIVLTVLLSITLLLVINIMLVGRLIGLAHLTSAWIMCIFLVVLLFPWQSFLQDPNFKADFKLPGVLYTWTELTHPTLGAKFDTGGDAGSIRFEQRILRWARFVGFPVVSIVMLLFVQAKSSRGLRAALGETELLDVTPGGDVRVS
jgi:hypothetical protein